MNVSRPADGTMARLIVCEFKDDWRTALGRELPQSLERLIRASRDLEECEVILKDWPASLISLEILDENLAGMLRWIADLEWRWPESRAFALSCRIDSKQEWALREAGVLDVLHSPRTVGTIIPRIERHFLQARHQEVSDRDRFLARLPWAAKKK